MSQERVIIADVVKINQIMKQK